MSELRSIDAKVAAEMEDSLARIVYPSESYRFTEQMHKENPDVEKLLSKGHKYDLLQIISIEHGVFLYLIVGKVFRII